MISLRLPDFANLSPSATGRWKLWALFAVVSLVAAIGTWLTGQYQIGRLDSLKNKYDQPVTNYAKCYGNALNNSLERDLLESCKQAQIGTWLQTTDALRFDGPLTGNRVDVRLDATKAYLDLNGREIGECIQDEVEDRQFDIGSMTNTWAIILLLGSFCLAAWAWACAMGTLKRNKRNIYAETLASEDLGKEQPVTVEAEDISDENKSDAEEQSPTSDTEPRNNS